MTGLIIKKIQNSNFSNAGECIAEAVQEYSAPRKCKFCGMEYKKTEIFVECYGKNMTFYSLPCDCLEKEQKRKEVEAAKKRLRERFQKANIGKRYEGITLEKLAEMGTEHIAEAQKYVSEFNPESGCSVHMIGEFGNGKTSVGYAVVAALLEKDFNCVSLTWNDFVSRCYYAKSFNASENLESILSGLSRFDLVMLDEFVINTKKEEETILATELFDRWYKDKKCFLLINNPCDIKDMKTVPRLGKLLDRVREQAEKWIFEHKSYRKKGEI